MSEGVEIKGCVKCRHYEVKNCFRYCTAPQISMAGLRQSVIVANYMDGEEHFVLGRRVDCFMFRTEFCGILEADFFEPKGGV